MAPTFVAYAAQNANTINLPAGWQAGDYAFVMAAVNGATVPSLPSGWTNVPTGPTASPGSGATQQSDRCGYRVLQSGDTDIGVWTNAGRVSVIVMRGCTLGTTAVNSGTGTSVATAALTLNVTDGTSKVLLIIGQRGATLTGFVTTVCSTDLGDSATDKIPAMRGALSAGVSSYSSEGYTSGSSTGWSVHSIELKAIATITGTAAFSAAAATTQATGTETISGTAAFPASSPSLAASGTETITGTSSFTAAAATFQGTAATTITGTAGFSAAAPATSASGTETIQGTAALAALSATMAATGSETLGGSGGFTAAGATLEATGSETIQGDAAFTAEPATFLSLPPPPSITRELHRLSTSGSVKASSGSGVQRRIPTDGTLERLE